jgi:hypothetical protein
MKSRFVLAVAVVVVLGLAACAQAAVIYDAGPEMAAYVASGTTGNLAPAFGQWTVGWRAHSAALTTNSFNAFTAGNFQQTTEIASPDLDGCAVWETSWAENMLGVQYSGSIQWNAGGDEMSTVTLNQMVVDQTVGTGTNMPVLRWTAPQDGVISVDTAFRAICENGTNAPISLYLLQGRGAASSTIFNATIGPQAWVNGDPDNRSRTADASVTAWVNAGDVIDVTSFAGSYVNLLAIDSHMITYVPEPGSVALLISGALGLVCYAWRKRK